MSISSLISGIRHASETLGSEPIRGLQNGKKDSSSERQELVAAAKDLIAAVEPPEDAIWNIILGVSFSDQNHSCTKLS